MKLFLKRSVRIFGSTYLALERSLCILLSLSGGTRGKSLSPGWEILAKNFLLILHLLSLNVGWLWNMSASSYEEHVGAIILKARFWIASNSFDWCAVRLECHTGQAYSSTDRISELKRLTRSSDGMPAFLYCDKRYSVLEAFDVIWCIWLCQDRSALMITPSSLNFSTLSISVQLMYMGSNGGTFLRS